MDIDTHFCPPFEAVPASAKIIIDLGCNDGATTQFFADRFKDAQIYGVELDRLIAWRTAERFLEDIRISIFHTAIGWPEGEQTAYIDTCSAVSTLTPYQHRETSYITVDVLSLDSFIERQNISLIDFIKIDIEGAEMMLLDGPRNWMDNTKCFIIECHSEQAIKRFSKLGGFTVRPLLPEPQYGNHLLAVQNDFS